jgi:hypothetical protein
MNSMERAGSNYHHELLHGQDFVLPSKTQWQEICAVGVLEGTQIPLREWIQNWLRSSAEFQAAQLGATKIRERWVVVPLLVLKGRYYSGRCGCFRAGRLNTSMETVYLPASYVYYLTRTRTESAGTARSDERCVGFLHTNMLSGYLRQGLKGRHHRAWARAQPRTLRRSSARLGGRKSNCGFITCRLRGARQPLAGG